MAPTQVLLVGIVLLRASVDTIAESSCPGGVCAQNFDEVSLLTVATKVHQNLASKEEGQVSAAGYFDMVHAELKEDKVISKCAGIQKAVLKDHAKELSPDVGTRIGQMLGAQFTYKEAEEFDTTCCAEGTEYDHFVLNDVKAISSQDFMNKVDATTALIIVDVQKDFTTGSFGQPCWGAGGDGFVNKIDKLARNMAGKGATIIASKDFHPADHCSFEGQKPCSNTKGYDDDAFHLGKRYVNEFPSHCTYTLQGGRVVPQEGGETPFCQNPGHKKLPACSDGFVGSALHPKIHDLMQDLGRANPKQAEIVFKGINKDYDSFSVIPHTVSEGKADFDKKEQEWTGGYAIPLKRKEGCYKDESVDGEKCLPTAMEIKDASNKMRSMQTIFKENGITNIVALGLVFDFCVKETAIFATQLKLEPKSAPLSATVLADLARPSFDGKPGVPYVGAVCTAKTAEGDYCTTGSGTTADHQNSLKDYQAAEVEVVRFEAAE